VSQRLVRAVALFRSSGTKIRGREQRLPQHGFTSFTAKWESGLVMAGTHLDITTLSTGRWELLRARNGVSPANEFIIYSEPSAGATFYVDSAEVLEALDLPPIP
jgi:hypothetical protein